MEALGLNDNAAVVLAYLIAKRQMVNSDWLEWEDYPNLSQDAFELLDEKVRTVVAKYLGDALRLMEMTWGIDAELLLELTDGGVR